MTNTIEVPDGYNGATVKLDATPLEIDGDLVKLPVNGKPWLIRWVHMDDWDDFDLWLGGM